MAHKAFIWLGPGVLNLDKEDDHEVIAEGIVKDKNSLTDARVDTFIKLGYAKEYKLDGTCQVVGGFPRTDLTPEQLAAAEQEAASNAAEVDSIADLAKAHGGPGIPPVAVTTPAATPDTTPPGGDPVVLDADGKPVEKKKGLFGLGGS